MPLDNMMDGVCGIRHLQFFVQIESGCAWNLSSNIFFSGVEQLVGSFFGGLISHVTSCPLWVREDDGHVTIYVQECVKILARDQTPVIKEDKY